METSLQNSLPADDLQQIARAVKLRVLAEQGSSGPLNFPDEIMAGVAGEFAETYAAHLEPAKHFFFMSFLVCLGNVIGDKVKLESALDIASRFYLLLLGESADDRKSTAASKSISFFHDVLGRDPESGESRFPVCRGVGSAEGLQKQLSENPRLLLHMDEFKALVSKCKIESSVLLPCLTTLFESTEYENHTAKKAVTIRDAHLSLLACSTIDTYETIFDEHFLSIGFPNRIFLCPGSAKRKYSLPGKIPTRQWVELKEKLVSVLDHAAKLKEIDITPEARELYHAWYMKIPQSVHAKRLDTYALRLMPLLAVNELKKVIDTEIVLKTTILMDWQYRVRRQHDPIDADNVMARIEEKIRRKLESGPKTRRDLSRAVNANRIGLYLFETAIKNLIIGGEIAFDKQSKFFFSKNLSSGPSS